MEQAMAGRRMAALVLSDDERAELSSVAGRRNTAQALALRARIVLRCATGAENRQVAADLRIDKTTVGKWRRRFVERRMDGLRDEPRSGMPRTIDDARIEAVIVQTLESLPADATHWSSRGMARQRPVRFHRTTHLARLRPAAAPVGDLQALHRPGFRRQGA